MSGSSPVVASPSESKAPMPTHDELEADVRGLPFPTAIIGTMMDPTDGEWLVGTDMDIMHVRWLIAAPDAADRFRHAIYTVDFGSVVDAKKVLLSDPARLLDQHSKRCACIALLNGRMGRRRSSAASVCNFGQQFDWFLRWRLSVGLERTALIEDDLFLDFLDRASRRGVLDMIPFEERVAELATRMADTGGGAVLRSMGWSEIAAELGVTDVALWRSAWARPLLDKGVSPPLPCASNPEKESKMSAPRSKRSAHGLLSPLEAWWMLSRLSALGVLNRDPMRVDPFKERTPLSYSCEYGDDSGKRGAVPPMALLQLLDAAAKWQLDWGSAILNAVELVRDQRPPLRPYFMRSPDEALIERSLAYHATLPAGIPLILLAWNNHVDAGADARLTGCITLAEAVGHFMTAGLLLFEAFGMLPADDALSLKAGCITGRETGLPLLSPSGRRFLHADAMPAPAMLCLVHDNLAGLTAPSMGADGVHWLFRMVLPHRPKKHTMRFPPRGYLRAFCSINGIAHADDAGAWRLTGREPRRGMAVWYHFCNTAGSLDSLSRLVNHHDPDRTRAWLNGILPERLGELHDELLARHASAAKTVSDDERAWRDGARRSLADGRRRRADFEGVRRDAIVATVLRVADGFETPGGLGGAAFREEVATLQALAGADVRIGARSNDPSGGREALVKRAGAFAKKNLLNPVPGGPAHCRCRHGQQQDLERAECLRIKAARGLSPAIPWGVDDGPDIQPDHAFSGFVPCLRCTHAVVLSGNRANSAVEVRRLENAVELASSPSAEAEARRLLEGVMAAVDAAEAACRKRDV